MDKEGNSENNKENNKEKSEKKKPGKLSRYLYTLGKRVGLISAQRIRGFVICQGNKNQKHNRLWIFNIGFVAKRVD